MINYNSFLRLMPKFYIHIPTSTKTIENFMAKIQLLGIQRVEYNFYGSFLIIEEL